MLDANTITEIILLCVAVIETLLSFTPKGFPKSILQLILWCGYGILKGIKKLYYKIFNKKEEDDGDCDSIISRSSTLKSVRLFLTVR
jgi:hypothetical protein